MAHEDLTEKIIGAAMRVHSALGPGLLESTYHACLQYEFATVGLHFESQVKLPVVYREITLEVGYKIDFWVENAVIVEIKAVDKLLPRTPPN